MSEKTETEKILRALSALRVPLQQGEYDLHRLVIEALEAGGLSCGHEVKLGPRCRIDLMCGSTGIEIKRGVVVRARLLEQLERYAESEQLTALVVVTEKSVALPKTIRKKPVYLICLNRLWGIAL